MTDYDLVLVGATGFTGALTATYLAENQPPGLRWAVAGRSQARLEAVRERLHADTGVDVGVIVADVGDPAAVRRVVRAGRAVATTVGPYVHYGEPLVAACAEAGTDYLDLTGEPEFVDRMYVRYDAAARTSGARLIHACGFDSIPHDLGALYTVSQLPGDAPIRMRGYVRAGGSVSGGTYASALNGMARTGPTREAHRQRRQAEPAQGPRRIRALPARPGYDRAIGRWVLPLPTVDPQIILRSATALDRYGPDFGYAHFVALKNPVAAAGLVAGVGAAFVLAQVPPVRRLLLRARPAGTGPSPQQRERSWFRVRFVADHPGGRLVTEVAGGDPGYTETAKMLAESALCLLTDDLPATSGQVTTAVALGEPLIARLQRAGITFETQDPNDRSDSRRSAGI